MRWPGLVLMMCVAACNGGGDDGDDDGSDGVCSGRPCLTSIDDEADWAAVSEPHAGARCDFASESKYLAPASAGAALQEIVFQDVKVHRFHLEFMTQALAHLFGGLPPQTYQAMVQRRATREYFAGAVFRVVDAAGATLGWGFDVIVDPALPDEQLDETEIAAVRALLMTRFHLELRYAPTEPEAIYRAQSFTSVPTFLPRACDVAACDDPGMDCVEVPAAAAVCGHFKEGRTVDKEYLRKVRLTAPAGGIALPREVGTYSVAPIFTSGEFGPARVAVAAQGMASYEVKDYQQFRSHVYTQTLTAGADEIHLSWDIPIPTEGGGYLLAEPGLSMSFYMNGAVNASTEYDDMLELSSCQALTLEHWHAVGTFTGGDGFEIDFQYQPPFAGSGPLFPTHSSVTLGGQTVEVADYFRLVYAGEHHNWNNQYWVLFDTPMTYLGHTVHGLWVDEMAYTSLPDGVYTLDANLAALDTLAPLSYVVEKVP